MAEERIKRIADGIYKEVGGQENVDKVIHCMTRVRMDIRDYDKVDIEGLKKIDGVMGVVEDDTLQVVVGPGTVNKVAQEMVDQAGVKLGEPFNHDTATDAAAGKSGKDLVEEKAAQMKAQQKAKQNNTSPFKKVLKAISSIFVPMIPAFVGAGIIGGIAAVMSNLVVAGDISASWQQYIDVLNIIKNGIFAYLALYTGINSASVFGATPALGGVIGAVTMLTGMNPDAPISNIFTPVAGAISNGLVGIINVVLEKGGMVAGFTLGLTFLPMVMFGLHQILTPIHIEMINQTGMTLLLPILAMAGAGQVGAALALWIRCKSDKKLVEMIKGALPVGILGIGEPLIYGVTLPLGRPFITACIGGGIGGAVIGALGNVGAIAIGPSGVALIPLIANNQWLAYVLGLLAAYAGGFVATLFFGIPKDMQTTK